MLGRPLSPPYPWPSRELVLEWPWRVLKPEKRKSVRVPLFCLLPRQGEGQRGYTTPKASEVLVRFESSSMFTLLLAMC